MSPSTTDAAPDQQRGLVFLSCLALITGLITGFGAIFFRGLIAAIHNLFFLGTFSVHYDANIFTLPGPWGPFIILAPVIGGMVVTALVTNFAPEARGHGVPEVMDAIYYKEGVIRPIVAVVKSIASAFSIGTGAAVGREGPIIQIGASLGSSIGQILRLRFLAAHHAGGRRRRRGHRGNLQHPDRRRHVRDRIDDAGSERAHLSSGSARHRHRHFRRQLVPRPAAGLCRSDLAGARPRAVLDDRARALCASGRGHGRGRSSLRARPLGCRGRVRIDRKPISAPRHRHAVRRRVDLCAVSLLRPLLRRGCRLRYDPGLADEPAGAARHPAAALCRQARGDLDQPRLRRVRRHFLAVAVYGRDARRRLRPVGQPDPSAAGSRYRQFRHRRHGGDGRPAVPARR